MKKGLRLRFLRIFPGEKSTENGFYDLYYSGVNFLNFYRGSTLIMVPILAYMALRGSYSNVYRGSYIKNNVTKDHFNLKLYLYHILNI